MNKKLQELVQLNCADSLHDDVLSALSGYYDLTLRWSEKINITANVGEYSYIVENILDPVLAYYALKSVEGMPWEGGVHDLGCGGGYVGLTWAMLDPTLKCTLVDSDRKKINFCKQAIRDLGLQGRVQAYQSRVEEIKPIEGVVTSRATWGGEGFFDHLKLLAHGNCVGAYMGGKNDPLAKDSLYQKVSYAIMPGNIEHHIFIQRMKSVFGK